MYHFSGRNKYLLYQMYCERESCRLLLPEATVCMSECHDSASEATSSPILCDQTQAILVSCKSSYSIAGTGHNAGLLQVKSQCCAFSCPTTQIQTSVLLCIICLLCIMPTDDHLTLLIGLWFSYGNHARKMQSGSTMSLSTFAWHMQICLVWKSPCIQYHSHIVWIIFPSLDKLKVSYLWFLTFLFVSYAFQLSLLQLYFCSNYILYFSCVPGITLAYTRRAVGKLWEQSALFTPSRWDAKWPFLLLFTELLNCIFIEEKINNEVVTASMYTCMDFLQHYLAFLWQNGRYSFFLEAR